MSRSGKNRSAVLSRSEEKLVRQVEELGHALRGIEPHLASSKIPWGVLADFRAAIDHIRITLWGVVTTANSEHHKAVASAIVRYRLRRIVDMCRSTILDIESGAVTADAAELPTLRVTLKDTLEHANQLYIQR
ncbi:MAG: hypothetical protein ACE5JU_21310 [Candidatus Binatia bacterium]